MSLINNIIKTLYGDKPEPKIKEIVNYNHPEPEGEWLDKDAVLPQGFYQVWSDGEYGTMEFDEQGRRSSKWYNIRKFSPHERIKIVK